MDLKMMLETVAARHGDKTAIVCDGFRMSYAELDEASDRLAEGLFELGVKKGDRVAMLLVNSPQFVVVYFGTVKIGAIAVPLDTKYKPGELTCILDQCRPGVLFTESPYLEPLVPLLPRLVYIEHIIDISSEGNGRFLSYEEVMGRGRARRPGVEISDDDAAFIAYTSGPAFKPRGAVLTHGNLVRAVKISADGFQQSDRDRVMLFALPMHHIVGLVIILLTSIYAGSTAVMLSGLSINSLLEVIEKERATIFIGVPFIHALIVKKAREEGVEYDLSSLRICGSVGAPLPLELAHQFERYLGLRLINFYGLTETTAHVTCQSLNGSGRPGSVGRALPGWQIKIVDDSKRELPHNHSGEVVIRGPIMSCYYQNPQDTARVVKNGWLYSGDIGKIDEEGNLFIQGVKKDMIITKGQNIYPSDIEAVLTSHPGVAEAAVAGIPDEMRGEVVGAAVVLKAGQAATEAEMKKFCLERLANFKVPKLFIFLESLPRNADGRISKPDVQKNLLKAYLA
jgi:long-chain acyl-CoA synthetase